MTVYVFTGPTLAGASSTSELDAVYLPPVEQGDVYRVTLRRPAAIGIIDGRFQDVPAVWHKEILWALAHGVRVYGSASMGALRAAELEAFGMRGVGWVFEAFRDGLLEDDDEVTVAHGSSDTDFQPTSDAMVNIRRTLSAAENAGVIDAGLGARLAKLIKAMFYPSRSYRMLLHLARRAGLPPSQVDALEAWLPEHQVDQKRIDAIEMLRVIRNELEAPAAPPVSFTFQHTQFFERVRRSAGDLAPAGSSDSNVGVTLEELLDELGLEPGTYARIRDRALIRCLALREFDRAAGTISDSDLQQTAEGFRRDRGLYNPHDIERWLADSHLTAAQFAALIREEHAVRHVVAGATPELGIHVRSQLRSDGLYPRLANRARHKRLSLAAAGLENPAAVQGDPTYEELLDWYFSRRGITAPDDISGHWKPLGFDNEIAFLRAVLRDYRFIELSGCHSASSPTPKEEANDSSPQANRRPRPAAATPHPSA